MTFHVAGVASQENTAPAFAAKPVEAGHVLGVTVNDPVIALFVFRRICWPANAPVGSVSVGEATAAPVRNKVQEGPANAGSV